MRLIDADVLMEQMKRRREFVGRASDPVCLVEDAPTIDAVHVVHGHWITKTRHEHYPSGKEYEEDFCSACGMRGSIEYDYCPHCGAKMDEVSE